MTIDVGLVARSLPDGVRKLDPRRMWRTPVMFVVEIGSVVTTVLFLREPSLFAGLIAVWLWLTQEQDRGHHRADLDHEHHRGAPHAAWI